MRERDGGNLRSQHRGFQPLHSGRRAASGLGFRHRRGAAVLFPSQAGVGGVGGSRWRGSPRVKTLNDGETELTEDGPFPLQRKPFEGVIPMTDGKWKMTNRE